MMGEQTARCILTPSVSDTKESQRVGLGFQDGLHNRTSVKDESTNFPVRAHNQDTSR